MASRKSPSALEWQVILERIEAQGRLILDAVQSSYERLDRKLDAFGEQLGGRVGNLETAVAGLTSSVDRLERRPVAALEKQTT